MLTKEALREYALDVVGVDKLGVANIERFDGAPADMDPRNVMPKARSVVVFAKRILRGTFRGVDEGTHWPSYHVYSYAGLNHMLGVANYRLARFIEQNGFDACSLSAKATSREFGPSGPPPAPGMPPHDVVVQFRIAATLAGLGEMGWSKVFMTREFGPRQRLGILLTDAELEPDPIIEPGTICDRCKLCARDCTGNAIPVDKTVKINLAGHEVEWADIDYDLCSRYFCGMSPEYNPFMTNFPEDEEGFAQEVSKGQRYKVGPTYDYGRALEGARGCIRACMMHLEEQGKIENTFKHPFRRRPAWKL